MAIFDADKFHSSEHAKRWWWCHTQKERKRESAEKKGRHRQGKKIARIKREGEMKPLKVRTNERMYGKQKRVKMKRERKWKEKESMERERDKISWKLKRKWVSGWVSERERKSLGTM